MSTDTGALIDAIRRDPDFLALVRRRTTFACALSGLMTAIYFGFILLVAFAPNLLGTPLGSGVTTIGIPVGLFVIFSAFVLTGLYVRRANTEFDALTEKLAARAK
ncbi:MAG: DUF485 domain-containing protein [Hyphomicrobium sp.]